MNVNPLGNKVLTGPAAKSPGGILLLVKVKEVTASGIVYDAESILESAAAKHHLETLRQVQEHLEQAEATKK
jgi:ribosomal protein S7